MLCLTDPPAVAALHRAAVWQKLRHRRLPRLTAPRCLGAHVAGTGFGVGEMQPFLGPDRPARRRQRLVVAGEGVGMDDPQINTGYPGGVDVGRFDRDRGGDVDNETAVVDQQGHRPDLFDRIRDVTGQAYPQLGRVPCGGEP